jgi:hypothetical protein
VVFQMVDLALPLGYHGRFRRLASVKLIGPQGPDEARLAVQQFTQRFWDHTTRHVVLPNPRRSFQGRASTRLTISRRFGRAKREED